MFKLDPPLSQRTLIIAWGRRWFGGASNKPGFLMEEQLRRLQRLGRPPLVPEPLRRLFPIMSSGRNSLLSPLSHFAPNLANITTVNEARKPLVPSLHFHSINTIL